jgi:hypothetical protein
LRHGVKTLAAAQRAEPANRRPFGSQPLTCRGLPADPWHMKKAAAVLNL